MWDRRTLERELAELGVGEFESSTQSSLVSFDLYTNYGRLKPVVEAAQKGTWGTGGGGYGTNHSFGRHGFEVYTEDNVPQISRLRIVTPPLWVGSKEFEKTIRNILVFAKQLKDGCTKAREKRIVIKNNAGKTVQGRPRLFETPNTTFGPIARLPFSKKVDPQHGDRFDPKDCSVWAQPLATITIPLWNVEKLIDRIEASEGLSLRAPAGKRRGLPLSGEFGLREGRRSVALYFAQRAVDKARKDLLAKKLVLSDRKTKVDDTTFTKSLSGFLILLASYLWTSWLTYDSRDFETDPETYLPISVKAPFSEILRWLEPTEQTIFRELFATGGARVRLFQLAQHGASLADGHQKLLPPGPGGEVHRRQQVAFGTAPTWNDLVDHTLDRNHNQWGDRLIVASQDQPFVNWRYSATRPDVALALRRIPTVDAVHWAQLMRTILRLTKELGVGLIDI